MVCSLPNPAHDRCSAPGLAQLSQPLARTVTHPRKENQNRGGMDLKASHPTPTETAQLHTACLLLSPIIDRKEHFPVRVFGVTVSTCPKIPTLHPTNTRSNHRDPNTYIHSATRHENPAHHITPDRFPRPYCNCHRHVTSSGSSFFRRRRTPKPHSLHPLVQTHNTNHTQQNPTWAARLDVDPSG